MEDNKSLQDIKELEDLIRPHIPAGSTVVSQKSTRLTMPGENYGSLMRILEVTIKHPNGKEETLNFVGKQIPTNPWLREVFKIQVTFVKEFDLYDKVVPCLVKFQQEQGMEKLIDFIPKCYGGRRNLNGSEIVDDDGVFLMENLKLKGYTTCDRFTGFDLDGAKFVLKDLAMFHAVPLALKIKQPETFKEEIASRIPFVSIFETPKEEFVVKFLANLRTYAREVEGCDEELEEKLVKAYHDSMQAMSQHFDGIFNTIVHCDFWINNTMVKVVDGKVIDNKMVDFQILTICSLAKDVVFFLYSSLQIPVVEEHYDYLLRVYYDSFIDVLQQLNCDTSPYTFQAFEDEITLAAKRSEFLHCIIMTKPMFAPVHKAKELDDVKEDDFLDEVPSEGELRKAKFIIKEFVKRKWI